MKGFLILVVCFSMVGESSALFGFLGNMLQGIGNILDFGVTTVNKLVDTGIRVGANVIGVVVDPFGIWKPSSDDHGHQTGQVVKCPAIADIIFVFDTSSSMQQREYDLEKTFAVRLTEHFKIGSKDVRFGGIVFSDAVQKVLGLGDAQNHSSLSRTLSNAPFLGGGTKTNNALDYIRTNRLFSTAGGARVRSSKIVIVITDGSSDSLFRTKAAADVLKADGVHIISVGIGSGLGIELYNIASGSKNVFRADSFEKLTRIEQSVARRTCEIPASEGYIPSGSGSEGASCQKGYKQNPSDPATCVDINECKTGSPCQQKCINLVGSFRCSCNDGFVIDSTDTTKCKALQSCSAILDIIFVLDASGSIGTDNFEIQQNFVTKLTNHFSYGRNGALYGALLFSSDVQKLFDLNTYSSLSGVTQALKDAPYLTGGTNTHKALNYITENDMFSTASGGRGNAVDIVIVVTDGLSSRENETSTAASNLKKKGYKILAVGVGDQISTDELVRIASSSDDVFVVGDFDLLEYIEQRLTEKACQAKTSG